uniref:Uncharacterized protein n=1 Tax=Ditylum brightwellii TaxID=49249 RepID=A0A7S4VC53_9STRA
MSLSLSKNLTPRYQSRTIITKGRVPSHPLKGKIHAPIARSYVSVNNIDSQKKNNEETTKNGEKEKKLFADSVEIAVRAYLYQKYPHSFMIQNKNDGGEISRVPLSSGNEAPCSISRINKLATLNGYHPLPPSKMITTNRVNLAEGVMAIANKTSTAFIKQNYIFYSRPSTSCRKQTFQSKTQQHRHVPFVQKNFRPFEILETKVEERLNLWEEQLKMKQKESVNYVASKVQDAIQQILRTVMKRRDESKEEYQKQQQVHDEQQKDNTTKLSTKGDNANNSVQEEIEEEDLIVLSRITGEMFLIENIPPSYRLLILPLPNASIEKKKTVVPYQLRHARSGRIITSSLVIFGAIPLMYRSLVFTMDHPWLARAVAASVVGSVGYSLWSYRYGARTRQDAALCAALSSRMVARDNTLVCALREEIVRVLALEVIDLYHSMSEEQHRLLNKKDDKSPKKTEESAEIETFEVAVALGLIQKRSVASEVDVVDVGTNDNYEDNNTGLWRSLSLSSAQRELSQKTSDFMNGRID